MVNPEENKLAFAEFIHEVLNLEYGLALKPNVTFNINRSKVTFDFADQGRNTYVEIIARHTVQERSKIEEQIKRNANLLVSSKRVKTKIIIVFSQKLSEKNRSYYTSVLGANQRIEYIILDFVELNNLGIKNGLEPKGDKKDVKHEDIKENIIENKDITKETFNELTPLKQDLILISDEIFEHLYKRHLKDSSFKFWLRQKDSNRSDEVRLLNGQWFQGSTYIFVGFSGITDSKNKTQSIGFVVNYSNYPDPPTFYTEISFPTESNPEILDCYAEILGLFGVKYNPKNKKYAFPLLGSGWREALDNFLVNHKPLIDKVIKSRELNLAFEISDVKFSRMSQKILNIRKNLFGKSGVGGNNGGVPPNDNDDSLSDDSSDFGRNDFYNIDDIPPVLGVEKLAEEIRGLISRFKSNDKGKIVGVFGNWGRGKTYLVGEVFKQLEKENKKLLAAKNNIIKSGGAEIEGTEYVWVKFHPWKYQDTPKSWAYLYEAFAKKYYETPKNLDYISRKFIEFERSYNISVNEEKDGPIPKYLFWTSLILLLFLGVLVVSDLGARVCYGYGFLDQLYTWVGGLSTFLVSLPFVKYISILYKNKKSEALSLFNKFYKRKTFEDVLGIQAEVEKELRVMLSTWIPDPEKKKVILFVDDIDRCSEDRIISIIDALRVMLEDEEISKRVIAIAAIDERVLRRAIYWKYNRLIEMDHSIKDCDPCVEIETKKKHSELLVSEYMDKLFIAGVKLGVLSEGDRETVLEMYHKYSNGNNSEIGDDEIDETQSEDQSDESSSSVNKASEPVDDSNFTEEEIIQTFSTKPEETEDEKENDSSEDVEPSKDLLDQFDMPLIEFQSLNNHIKKYSNATPRQIRIFYFRYLLGRNILHDSMVGNSFDSRDVVEARELFVKLLYKFTIANSVVSDYFNYLAENKQKIEKKEIMPTSVMTEIYSEVISVDIKISEKVIAVIEMVKAY